MITYKVSDAQIKNIESELGELHKKAPEVLKKSLNQTAKEGRKLLSSKAKETYTVKNARFNKAMKVKNATNKKLAAYITAEGKPLSLYDFRIKSNTPTDAAKAKALVTSRLKSLTLPGASDVGTDLKAFVQTVGSHTGIFQRLTAEQRQKQQEYFNRRHYKAGKRSSRKNAIRELKSSSIPKMIGDERRVYGIIEPKIELTLHDYIQKNIKQVLER